jgi:rifampicin phosphotransferase
VAIIPLAAAANRPLEEVGGKARALGRLISAGAPVPPGFVVPPSAAPDSAEVLQAHAALGAGFVAVRSSAAGEDSGDKSWAGQFETYLSVQGKDLTARIVACRRSGASDRARAYHEAGAGMPVAVIVQAMVPADTAGVLFTANPVSGDRTQVMIEAVYGLGEQLVSGVATPDNYVLDKATGRTLRQHIAEKETMLVGGPAGVSEQPVPYRRRTVPALNPAQLAELTGIVTRLEAEFRHPLDIEWAYAAGKPFILQARPITTLSGGNP